MCVPSLVVIVPLLIGSAPSLDSPVRMTPDARRAVHPTMVLLARPAPMPSSTRFIGQRAAPLITRDAARAWCSTLLVRMEDVVLGLHGHVAHVSAIRGAGISR